MTAESATVYECTGYVLPAKAEPEYAPRAGVCRAFNGGDITLQSDECGAVLDELA